jgi:hypothetical protein
MAQTHKFVTYDATGAVVDCLFCRIANSRGEPNPIWYSDDRVAVIVPNRSLAGQLHFLVLPRQHVHQLGPNMVTKSNAGDLPGLLDHMRDVGAAALSTAVSARVRHEALAAPSPDWEIGRIGSGVQVPPGCHLGFHRPPFNSVDHLHLHAVCPPFRSVFQRAKFLPGAQRIGDDEGRTSFLKVSLIVLTSFQGYRGSAPLQEFEEKPELLLHALDRALHRYLSKQCQFKEALRLLRLLRRIRGRDLQPDFSHA